MKSGTARLEERLGAPRFSMVYDLFGNARTAVKYSLNKYNLSRTTGIAGNYNPLASTTRALPWTDLNGDDIAQGESTIINGQRVSCVYLTSGCEMYNVNNSDAIISYQSMSILSAQYLAPNSIMQPRMIGIGAQVKW